MPSTTIHILEELSNAIGISGHEHEVRAAIEPHLEGLVDEVRTDTLGNLIATRRGTGPASPCQVTHLPPPLTAPEPPDPRLPDPAPPLPYGPLPGGGRHVPVPEEGLDGAAAEALAEGGTELVVTPWRGVVVPGEVR